MATHTGSARRTDRRPPLTRGRILDHALTIIDEEGLQALNMRRLAAVAGVKAMSLYHHFPSKDAILSGVAECIAAAALGESHPVRRHGEPWQPHVRRLFVGLYDLIQSHPRALPLISTGVLKTPSGRRWMEELMGVLLEAGFSPAQAARLYHTLGAYTLGLGYAGLLSLEVPLDSIVGELAGHWDDYPSLLLVGVRLAAWDRPDEYAAGLDALLAHFEAVLDREAAEEGRR